VRGMKRLVADPGRQDNLPFDDHFFHPVPISPPYPFLDGQVVVKLQGVEVAGPHPGGGMTAPAARPHRKDTDKLMSLEPLFTEPPVIENLQGPAEIGIGQKSLHGC